MTETHTTFAAPLEFPADPPWEAEEHDRFNVASYLPARAAERPYQKALIQPEGYTKLGKRAYSHLTYVQLDALCDAYAHGLRTEGFQRGDHVLLLVTQGLELIALTFALFKMGVVPVLIDPGMGVQGFRSCVESVEPVGFIGIPRAHAVRRVFASTFGSVKRKVVTEPKWWAGAAALNRIADFSAGAFSCEDTERDELAAILFTSGSTGAAKGVEYTHGIFDGQVKAIGQMYGIEPGEIEVPAFPLFSLFSIALGMTVVIPDMDPTKPAEVNPMNIVEAILDHGATTAFGSPAIWARVGPYCAERGIRLPTLRRILTAGAPINPALMKQYEDVLSPGVSLHTPYGATENLPVSSIDSGEVLAETQQRTREGAGLCVGRAVPNMRIKIVRITDDPIPTWGDAEELVTGEIGEICVSGQVTTRRYYNKPQATAAAKIQDPERGADAFWHRMGDVGYLDDRGRLWYCGRKAHRVVTADATMFSIACESIFNAHEKVFRTALVGVGARGSQRPVLLVEPEKRHWPHNALAKKAFIDELLAMAKKHESTSAIADVLFHEGFPVDRRHNAKIHREELAVWAASRV